MRIGCTCLALIVGLALVQPAAAETKNTNSRNDTEQIDKLINNLGSKRFAIRERARVALEKIGAPALAALRKATESKDMEVSRTASKLVEKIERRRLTQQLLAPKTFVYNVKNATLAQAIKELVSKSGYDIQLKSGSTVTAKRISLDLGKTTFWKAFDRLCQEAELVETLRPVVQRNNPYRGITTIDRAFPVPAVVPLPAVKPIPFKKIAIPIGKINKLNAKKMQELIKALKTKGAAPKELRNAIEKIQKELEKQRRDALKELRKLRKAAKPGLAVGAVELKAAVRPVAAKAQVKKGRVVRGKKVKKALPPVRRARGARARAAFEIEQLQRARPNTTNTQSSKIEVRPGKAARLPTYYVGALRIQVVSAKRAKNEAMIKLRITAEPGIAGFNVLANPTITKILDDYGQRLKVVRAKTAPAINPNNPRDLILRSRIERIRPVQQSNNEVTIRFKYGTKRSKTLKELNGKLTVQLLTPPKALVTINNVMKNTGKVVKGKGGSSLEVVSIRNIGGNRYQVRVAMDGTNTGGAMIGGGGVIIRGGGVWIGGRRVGRQSSNPTMLTLVDKNGKAFRRTSSSGTSTRIVGGRISQQHTLTFQAEEGQGAPDRLILKGSATENLGVPFQFKNIVLR